jgi:aspartyl-tRNA(Asn)/glutamyl-tRNA(Gln) amidotransferase subunit C
MDARELATTARMARLTLTPIELAELGAAVERMLAHFSHMKEINMEGLEPTTHALVREARMRVDALEPSSSSVSDGLLTNAPEREDRFIAIPNVL